MSFFSSYPLYLETPLQQTELQLGRPMSVSATAGAGGVTFSLFPFVCCCSSFSFFVSTNLGWVSNQWASCAQGCLYRERCCYLWLRGEVMEVENRGAVGFLSGRLSIFNLWLFPVFFRRYWEASGWFFGSIERWIWRSARRGERSI